MTHESFHNPDELFVQLFARHERDLRGFIRSMGLEWVAVDDVMQTVSLVMWRKWGEFDPESSFMQWGRVIARFEVLKFRRKLARDRHVFREEVMELLASAAEEWKGQSDTEEYRTALRHCLDSLPDKSAQLIRRVYGGDQTIREVAEELGESATAFYKTLNRIREQLRLCIREKLSVSQ